MPKYFEYKVADCYLYFTAHCYIEAMHAHASDDKRLREAGSAKFWVGSNGDTKVAHKGSLNDNQVRAIQRFIKKNYEKMYETWSKNSDSGYYENI